MNFLEKAYFEIFNEHPLTILKVKYSRSFKAYNANVKYDRRLAWIEFSLSHLWEDTSDEIKIGLIQHLLCKIYKVKKKTLSQDLYELFLKNAHLGLKDSDKKIDPDLKPVFDKINELYFIGMLDIPNLFFGGNNLNKLGSYTYASDTIMISNILRKDELLLEFVMYHEMLHKKLKFKRSGSKTYHHTKEFKELESKFYDKNVEKKLTNFIRKEKLKSLFNPF